MHMKCSKLVVFTLGLLAVQVATPVNAITPQSPDHQVKIVADEMCCKGCARKVSGQLYAARGVKNVKVDMQTRTVTVSLPKPSGAMLGQLWNAVAQGDGGPSKLVTSEATYSLIPHQPGAPATQATQQNATTMNIVVDNLHCMGCARKIAGQLYVVKGVTQVSVDMQTETLIVQTQPGTSVSAWQVLDAVGQANERPTSITGSHGKLAIQWRNKAAVKHHQQAQNPLTGGSQR